MNTFGAHKKLKAGLVPLKRAAFVRRIKPGMTLVELLVVMVVSVVILGAAVTLYQINARVYVQQDALLEQTQNLRVGMYTVARDVRMAGNSFPLLGADITHIQVFTPDGKWFKHSESSTKYGVRAIFGQDGDHSGSDSLTIFRADVESGSPVGQLAGAVNPNGSQSSLTLQEEFMHNTLNPGDIIALVNGSQAAILQVSTNPDHFPKKSPGGVITGTTNVIQLGTTRFVPGKDMEGSTGFPAGSYVYNLRDVTFVTYSVDDKYNLVADYHDTGIDEFDSGRTVVVATNIEDFQVRYIYGGSPIGPQEGEDGTDESKLDEPKLDNGHRVVAVNLAMVSRSILNDGSKKNFPPQKLFNRQYNGSGDGYQRRVLTETIFLRNFAQ